MYPRTTALSLLVCSIGAISTSAHAQACDSIIAEMQAKYRAGFKTAVTIMTQQANGVSEFSGPGAGIAGVTSDARLVPAGPSAMSSSVPGGSFGLFEYSDRPPNSSGYSADPKATEQFDVYLSATYFYIRNRYWGNYQWVFNPRCENGVIWGFGTAVGNANGSNRALFVLSFGYTI